MSAHAKSASLIYVTRQSDIVYAIMTIPKFTTKPSVLHYNYLKQVAKYFYLTKDWGIKIKRTGHPVSFVLNTQV